MKNTFNQQLMKITITTLLTCCGWLAIAAEAPAKPVKVDSVLTMSLAASTQLNATLHSRSHIPITAGVNGRLEWLAQPGDYIEQGQVLVKMDVLPLELKRAEQLAELKRAQINVDYLKTEFNRLQKLSKTNATSQFQLDQNRSKYELAQADIEIAELKLKQIEDQLNRATITAPFAGVVTERIVRAGTDINRSDTLLMFLDTEHLEARLFIPIKYLGFVNKGHLLTLSASEQVIEAPVSAKIPSADPRSQTFEVRIDIPTHLNQYWAAGQLVRITVPVQAATESLTVPRDALILRKEATYVVKVESNNTVQRLPVTVGKGNVDRVSIRGALKHGDKVAIRGAERLVDGDKVIIQ
ncbi:efflux RND transporter periplasmic adaptor subunit [Thalassotalea sp. PLHSN55]|uniref:efflux RND transporter periplasmic adaptor subunit n=1 Tax=Thalassotalea sp. PLHSN55 TaxID=3435888 RepID=UPI003F85DA52